MLVSGGAGGKDEWGREAIYRNTIFYADDGLVASTESVWSQGVFDTITGFFDRVRLRNNSRKMVGTICRP